MAEKRHLESYIYHGVIMVPDAQLLSSEMLFLDGCYYACVFHHLCLRIKTNVITVFFEQFFH